MDLGWSRNVAYFQIMAGLMGQFIETGVLGSPLWTNHDKAIIWMISGG